MLAWLHLDVCLGFTGVAIEDALPSRMPWQATEA